MIRKKFALVTAALIATISFNSCTVGGFTDEKSVKKLPEPVKTMMVDLIKEENQTMQRCAQGSSELTAASAIIAEGCGLEKEAQVLRSHAAALGKTSSADDKRKYVIKGTNLISDVNAKLAASKNVTVVSKQKFEQGYKQKVQAEKTLNQVAMREIPNSLSKAAGIAIYVKNNQQSIKSNPLQMAQVLLAANYSLLPIRFVANDYRKFGKEREKFEEQCQLIGKNYNIRLPAPQKAPTVQLPKGISL